MTSKQDILWKYYQEDLKHAQIHESTRSTITNIIILICGIIISFIASDEVLNSKDMVLCIFLIFLGGFGMLFNAKYYERYNFHYQRSKAIRLELENEYPDIKFEEIRERGLIVNKNKFKLISKIRLNGLWIFLNAIFSLVGLILLFLILIKIFTK